jgi:hypothetical protein
MTPIRLMTDPSWFAESSFLGSNETVLRRLPLRQWLIVLLLLLLLPALATTTATNAVPLQYAHVELQLFMKLKSTPNSYHCSGFAK